MWFANIFSQSLTCLFIFSLVLFEMQMLLIPHDVQDITFSFYRLCFWKSFWKLFAQPKVMKAFSCVNSRSLIVLALAFRSMIILSWFLFILWGFAYFDINCSSSICLTDYPSFIELSWHICWMGTGILKVSLVQTKLRSKLPKGASISHLCLSTVDKDLDVF